MSRYAKFLTALGAAIVAAGTVLADGVLDPADPFTIAAAFLGALGVYLVPNTPKAGQ
jgi:hypothetical protein